LFALTGIIKNTLGEQNLNPWSQLGLDTVTTFIQYFTVIFQSGISGKNYSVRYDYENVQISAICELGN